MGQAFSLGGTVAGGGTTAPPFLTAHAVKPRRPAALEWVQEDDRDWLETPESSLLESSPLATRVAHAAPSSTPPSLAELMGMESEHNSASDLHRRVAMTRRFTQLSSQLSTGTPSPKPTAATSSASSGVSATSAATAASAEATVSSSGSDYTECLDDGEPHGAAARMPPVPAEAVLGASTPAKATLRLSVSPGTQLPYSPSSAPGSKIPVLSPQATVSARNAALAASDDDGAEADSTPVRAWLAACGLSHYTEAFQKHGYTGDDCAEVLDGALLGGILRHNLHILG